MLSDSCPVCLSVCPICDVGALWPNGWTDQNETWLAGRPRPWPHCVRWGPSSPSPKGAQPQFSEHTCCSQMAAWIKMPLGMEVGLGPGDFVLDWDPLPSPEKGGAPKFSVHVYCGQTAGMDQDGIWHGGRPRPRTHCVRWGPSSLPR